MENNRIRKITFNPQIQIKELYKLVMREFRLSPIAEIRLTWGDTQLDPDKAMQDYLFLSNDYHIIEVWNSPRRSTLREFIFEGNLVPNKRIQLFISNAYSIFYMLDLIRLNFSIPLSTDLGVYINNTELDPSKALWDYKTQFPVDASLTIKKKGCVYQFNFISKRDEYYTDEIIIGFNKNFTIEQIIAIIREYLCIPTGNVRLVWEDEIFEPNKEIGDYFERHVKEIPINVIVEYL